MRDAQGNILATYQMVRNTNTAGGNDDALSLVGHDIYGSSRLGTRTYWPGQVGVDMDFYRNIYDTVRLWERRPWYTRT